MFLLIIILSDFREGNTNLLYTGLMVTMVKTIARAHRDLCVLAVLSCCIMLLCCIMQSIFYANFVLLQQMFQYLPIGDYNEVW